MTLEFLATLVAGAFGAGVAMILRKLTGEALPRWLVPALAAAGMLGMSLWSEYSWYPRLQAGLPAGAKIAHVEETRAVWRPWTFAVPLVTSAVVVDTRRTLRNPQDPDLALTQVLFFARWQNTRDAMVTFDCANARRVDVTTGVRFTDSGELQGGTWVPLPADDPVLRTACDGG